MVPDIYVDLILIALAYKFIRNAERLMDSEQ